MVHLSVLANITNNSSSHDIFVKTMVTMQKTKMIYIRAVLLRFRTHKIDKNDWKWMEGETDVFWYCVGGISATGPAGKYVEQIEQ